ncbi:MAG: DNA polymerase I [Clostridiales Family XIII bacterium]|nr:DNA polymerase I [Clostridiales Family XIII bacterium]
MNKNENKTLIIIDGNSLINRAYYAIQRPMITKDGIHTQGIYGFLTMLSKIRADYDPAYLTVTFDRKAPTFRHIEYDEYKAGRKKMPMELAMELPYLKEILDAMQIVMLEIDGFEADDIIGTVARAGEENGLSPYIITGDRDALQLASEKTRIIITKKGISEFGMYDAAGFFEEYGFPVERFIDLKGLMGDSSDNIPGIPGVGKQTATKLLLQFDSIENIIENVDEISNEKLRQKVKDYAQQARMSKKLATIVTDVPIEIDFNRMQVQSPNLEKLVPLYVKLEFNSFLKNMDLSGLSSLSSSEHAVTGAAAYFESEVTTEILLSADEVSAAMAGLAGAEEIVLKVFGNENHRNLPEIYGIHVFTQTAYFYIPIDGDVRRIEAFVDGIIEGNLGLVSHEVQKDLYMLFAVLKNETEAHPEDVSKAERFYRFSVPNIRFDTAIAQYVLDPGRSTFALKNLLAEYFNKEIEAAVPDLLTDRNKSESDYGREVCRAIYSLRDVLRPQMEREELANLFDEVEMPLVAPLAEMEAEGFSFDGNALDSIASEIDESLRLLTKQIYEMSGEEFNINSPQQLGVVLFEKMGLPSYKKTKTGYATGAEVLEKLRDKSPIIDDILEYRTLAKLRSTYIEGLRPLVAKDGKIHAHFQQTVTTTGRISCTEPNLQNIPVRQELGRRIRRAFVPESDEYVLIGADYSQIELRILAALSEDAGLLEDFRQGADIHKRTASRVFGIPEAEVTSLQRSNAKAVNFGIIYGMSSFGLSTGLDISRGEAEAYIQEYFKTHGGVKRYLDQSVKDAKTKGYAMTVMGRKRNIPELSASNYMVRQLGERLAMNTPIQGSAADIIKLAMIRVYRALQREKLRSRVILQVHDELIVQAYHGEEDQVRTILEKEMGAAYPLGVPLAIDIHEGTSWFDLK